MRRLYPKGTTLQSTDLHRGQLVTFWLKQRGYHLGRVLRQRRDGLFIVRALFKKRLAAVKSAIPEKEPHAQAD